MKKTERMFASGTPYGNSYQTDAKRLVFVCSVGMLRSPTAQIVASDMGFNARACGSDLSMALIPLSHNLITWADNLIFMNVENYTQALLFFNENGYDKDIRDKAIIWDIDDDYEWNNAHLKKLISSKLCE